jgi:2-polyprenyl-6-methoxyphenol hydroxylase-like FAD-dependent oxidoreductase
MFPDDRYHSGSQLSGSDANGNRVSASLAAVGSSSDLFIAADGSSSEIRRRLLPDVLPNYAGYVAWRGTLEEAEAGPGLKSFFERYIHVFQAVPADTS